MKIKISIRLKLLLTMISLIIGVLMFLTFIQISSQKKIFKKEVDRRLALMKKNLLEQGNALSDTIAHQVENDIASFNFSHADVIIKKTVTDDPELSYGILMDNAGKAYIHTLKPELQQEILSEAEDKFALKQNKATFKEYRKNGTSFLEFIIPIQVSISPWGFLRLGFSLELLNKEMIKSKNDMAQQTKHMVMQSMATSATFIVIACLIILFIAQRLTRPLIGLTKSAEQLAQGNFDVALNFRTNSRDEVGVLATTFKEMAGNLKTSRSRLEELLAEVREKNKELEQLMYISAHDMRGPMVNVQGFSQELELAIKELANTLLNEASSPQAKEAMIPLLREDIPDCVQLICKNISKMNSLLSGILLFSRLGRDKLNFKNLDMNYVLSESLRAFKFEIEKKNIKVITSKLPSCVADTTQMQHVFSLLLENALHFVDLSRSAVIKVSGKSEKNQVIYCVEDNGIGIAAAYHQKIFNLFYCVDAVIGSGKGLGLTLAYKIIGKVNGKIWVDSELGKGSKFYFSLPS
ncbi:ATP-binding protein [Candidatus Auribacterota bacterium]